MARLNLTLLGGFRASLDSGVPLALPTRKAQALLAYLALDPGRTHSRDTLASLLWGERGNAQARKSLRQTVYALRKAVSGPGAPLLMLEGAGVAVTPSAVEVDAPRFERLVKEGTPEALERAAALYQGDFLHGFCLDEAAFEEWLVAQRERLRELAIDGLAKLVAHQASGSGTEPAIQTAMRLLGLDPLQEVVHRALMRLYARQGRRAAALRQYQMCVDLLRRELRTEPEAETRRLYQELLQQRHDAHGQPEAAPGRSELPARPSRRRERLELPALGTPLIGRDIERERLRNLLQQAEEGKGHVAIVLGEAGIGKSRLLADIAAQALETGSDVLLGRAFESEQSLGFGPWVAAIRGSRVLEEPRALDALAPVWQRELARLFPELGEPVETSRQGGEDYLRLFEALERWLGILAGRRPMVLLLEDLHWADDMSLRLLSYVGRRSHGWKLLVVVSARQEELVDAAALRRAIDELLQERHAVELRLAPLTRSDIIELVRSLRPGQHAPADLEEQIWTASEGNPFMAVEIIRALEQGAEVSPATALPVPERVRRLITGRLDRLSDRGQQLAAVAAVIGREFEFNLLQRAGGLSAREAAEVVEELVRRRVLHGAGERLDFAHDWIREVLYRRLLPPRRRVLHREVAGALATIHAEDGLQRHDRSPELYETLAWHYTQGEEWSKAADNLMKAAEKTRGHGAYDEASRRCTEAIEILDRQGGAEVATARAFEMLGDLESIRGHVGPANQAYDRALRMSADAAIRQRIADKRHRPRTVVRAGVRIAYYEHGSGEPTLFLTHPVFYGQGTYQPLLDLLCHEFRIITADPRGAGGSDPLPAVYRLTDHVEDARAVIEGAGDRPVVFVGMSRAAALGVTLATTYPHLVDKLVLVGTPPGVTATVESPGIDQTFWQQVVSMIEAGDYERAMPLFWAREFSEPDSRDLAKTFVQASLEMPREVFRVFFTVPDPGRDIRRLLPSVRVPTLVLHGEEDRVVPVEAGRWVAQQIPGAQFYAFKGCGHLPAFTAPVEFARVVRNFLRPPRPV